MLRRNFLTALTALFPSLASTKLLAKEQPVQPEPEQPYPVIQDDWIKRGSIYRALAIPADVLTKLFETIPFEEEVKQRYSREDGFITNTIGRREAKVFLPQHHAYVVHRNENYLVWGPMCLVQTIDFGGMTPNGERVSFPCVQDMITSLRECDESHITKVNDYISFDRFQDKQVVDAWLEKCKRNAAVLAIPPHDDLRPKYPVWKSF